MFHIDDRPEFDCTVPIALEGVERQSITVRYRALANSEIELFDLRTAEGTTDFLHRVVARVDDVVDDDGKPVPFTPALLDRLLDLGWVRQPMVRSYFAALAGARLGN